MNTIKRDVYVLRNTIKIPIEVTKGTDAISFEFTVRDYNLPVTAAAVAYAYRGGMKKPNSTLCNVEDNVISFQPSANFFEVGNNELQIRVINEDKSLISFKERVNVLMQWDSQTMMQKIRKRLWNRFWLKQDKRQGNEKQQMKKKSRSGLKQSIRKKQGE